MPTLHIEHAITDFDSWSSAFSRFADVRREAGARAERVRRPVDDPRYVVIDVDFGTSAEAEAFLRFLETQVWPSATVLVGTPKTSILEDAVPTS